MVRNVLLIASIKIINTNNCLRETSKQLRGESQFIMEPTANEAKLHKPIIVPQIKEEPSSIAEEGEESGNAKESQTIIAPTDDTAAAPATTTTAAAGSPIADTHSANETDSASTTPERPTTQIKIKSEPHTDKLGATENSTVVESSSDQQVNLVVPSANVVATPITQPKSITPPPPITIKEERTGDDAGLPLNEATDPPDEFFDEILESVDDIRAAAKSPTINVKLERSGATDSDDDEDGGASSASDTIPQGLLDELMILKIPQRSGIAACQGREIKYSEQLRAQNELQTENVGNGDAEGAEDHTETRSKAHKKHKKSKKKSHKRSHNEGEEQGDQHAKRRRNRNDSIDMELDAIPSGSLTIKQEFRSCGPSIFEKNLECLPVHYANNASKPIPLANSAFGGFKRIKLEKQVQESTEPKEPATPKEKREQAMLRVAELVKEFQKAKSHKFNTHGFLYTPTIRKLPTSSSFVTQQIYENRSPLHTVNNVEFKFNSHATRIKLHAFGLEPLSEVVAHTARTIGYDVYTLADKLKVAKIKDKIRTLGKTDTRKQHGETVEEIRSSFFANAMTQTDDVRCIDRQHGGSHSIGVQATVMCGSIGIQTATSGPSRGSDAASNADLPLMQLMKVLTEHQLLAVNDFAELILEPPANGAADMYRLRQRIFDIYKSSQAPGTSSPNMQAQIMPPTPAPLMGTHHHNPNVAAYNVNVAHAHPGAYGDHGGAQHNYNNPYDPRLQRIADPRLNPTMPQQSQTALRHIHPHAQHQQQNRHMMQSQSSSTRPRHMSMQHTATMPTLPPPPQITNVRSLHTQPLLPVPQQQQQRHPHPSNRNSGAGVQFYGRGGFRR